MQTKSKVLTDLIPLILWQPEIQPPQAYFCHGHAPKARDILQDAVGLLRGSSVPSGDTSRGGREGKGGVTRAVGGGAEVIVLVYDHPEGRWGMP